MKKALSLLFLGLAVMVGLSMTAFADTAQIYFNGNYTATADGYGAGLYGGSLNGGAQSNQFICDDFPDHIQGGESWTANVTNLSSLATNSIGVHFPDPNSQSTLAAYSEVAWLAENMFSGTNTNGSVGNLTDAGSISAAIWFILDDPGQNPSPNYVTAAEAWWGGLSDTCKANPVACGAVQNMDIYTPIDGTQVGAPVDGVGHPDYPQEFLAQTPEPISMALMGTFLTLAGLGLGRKKLLS